MLHRLGALGRCAHPWVLWVLVTPFSEHCPGSGGAASPALSCRGGYASHLLQSQLCSCVPPQHGWPVGICLLGLSGTQLPTCSHSPAHCGRCPLTCLSQRKDLFSAAHLPWDGDLALQRLPTATTWRTDLTKCGEEEDVAQPGATAEGSQEAEMLENCSPPSRDSPHGPSLCPRHLLGCWPRPAPQSSRHR